MQTFRFRDFQVYKDARAFRLKIVALLKEFPSSERYRLIDQIHRSCLSIVLNIAEGSAKHSDADFARFLEMSIASVNETVAGFDVACDDNLIDKNRLQLLEQDAENLARQLGGFIKKLRSSEK